MLSKTVPTEETKGRTEAISTHLGYERPKFQFCSESCLVIVEASVLRGLALKF